MAYSERLFFKQSKKAQQEAPCEEYCPESSQASLNQFRKYICPFFSLKIPEALLSIEQSCPFIRQVVRFIKHA